ncbi:hypothetical protein VNO78_04160 [Psophocarpus tetragonolobus]|uniref:adenylate dimethylallyltransferase (ADP/ATP-dependent) n=1 Tax=Psophocarpus tetragonolobus TaxID=3891 RepID=A0AAN9T1L5_PSOTE
MNISISTSGSVSACKQEVSLVNLQKGLTMFQHRSKDKVVVIIGATGTGKTKLAIDVAKHFRPAEIVNSDKMQVYKGLDITTNKVSEEEREGVPHHLLGTVDPNINFSANDFCRHATMAIDSIVERDGLPIIAGGSNSYLDALVNHYPEFRLRYQCCFLWVDVSIPVLHSSLNARVDRMIDAGQVKEVRNFFHPNADYTKGIRRAIGVPEFHDFLRAEASGTEDDNTKKTLLQTAIARIKINNCTLANRQIQKIHRLQSFWKRNMHRLDATEVFLGSPHAWHDHVLSNTLIILHNFLYGPAENKTHLPPGIVSPKDVIAAASVSPPPVAMAATR